MLGEPVANEVKFQPVAKASRSRRLPFQLVKAMRAQSSACSYTLGASNQRFTANETNRGKMIFDQRTATGRQKLGHASAHKEVQKS